jgi:DNA-binding GntR family transcriptional regulator
MRRCRPISPLTRRCSMRVEEHLRAAIVSGDFQPNEHLVEAEVARRYGVGRAAVRTALARLEQEGLVQHVRNRGARVRLVDLREAIEIVEARAALEGLAARHAATRRTDHDVEELEYTLTTMRELLDRGDLIGASDENAVLHRRITEISCQLTVARLVAGLKSQVVRFQYRTILVPGRSEASFEEHSAIVDAITRKDPDAAEAAMRGHLHNVAKALEQHE